MTKVGQGIKYLFALLDNSGSMEGSKYVVNPFNSLIDKKRDEVALVTLATFGTSQCGCDLTYIYEMIPIKEIPKIKSYDPTGSSPVYLSICQAIEKIKTQISMYPISLVDLVVISDFNNEEKYEYHGDCKQNLIQVSSLGWNLAAIFPHGSEINALDAGFTRKQLLEIKI
jgi:hypothetical protein